MNARIQRDFVCLLLVLFGLPAAVQAQTLSVRLDGDQLRVVAPRLSFLTGDALERLQDGVSVNYVFEIAISAERSGGAATRTAFRFVVSYDLWEEKFAVTRLAPSPRSVSHLSLNAAESWCLEALTIPVPGFAPQRPFWVSLDYRVEAPRGSAAPAEDSGFTLDGLIDIFSLRTDKKEVRGSRQAGPFRLADLRRSPVQSSP